MTRVFDNRSANRVSFRRPAVWRNVESRPGAARCGRKRTAHRIGARSLTMQRPITYLHGSTPVNPQHPSFVRADMPPRSDVETAHSKPQCCIRRKAVAGKKNSMVARMRNLRPLTMLTSAVCFRVAHERPMCAAVWNPS